MKSHIATAAPHKKRLRIVRVNALSVPRGAAPLSGICRDVRFAARARVPLSLESSTLVDRPCLR